MRRWGRALAEGCVNGAGGKEAGKQGAESAASAVDAEGIERVVIAQAAFDLKDHEGAEDAGDETDEQRRNGCTKPEAGVMATSPATAPEMAPRAVGLPLWIHSAMVQPKAAAAAAKCVLTKALVASGPEPRAQPALNPNQPTQSRQAPIKLSTMECGGMVVWGYPMRLPR